MSRRLRLARRELASLRSEKTVVLALLIQLFIAAFSSFLVVGLVSLYDPGGATVEFGVVGDDATVEELTDIADDENAWTMTRYSDSEGAREALDDGDVDAVLNTDRGGGGVNVELVAPRGELRTTVAVTAGRNILERFEDIERERRAAELGVNTVPVPEGGDAGPYHAFTYAVLIPLLVFLPAFISGSISSDAVTEEYERGTLDLLRVSPLSDTAIFDGKALTPIVIAPAQAALWLLLLSFNDVPVSNPVSLLALVTGVTAVLVAFGAGIGLRFRERKQAQFVYSVGAVAVFALTFALPESSGNTVAKLASGAPTMVTYGHAAFYVVLGVVAYFAVRRLARREVTKA